MDRRIVPAWMMVIFNAGTGNWAFALSWAIVGLVGLLIIERNR